jgi:hypothetical protein
MPSEPLLTNFFGPGVTQNLTDLIIKKADLIAPVGLTPTYEFTPTATDGSEKLFSAMLLRAVRNQDPSTDAQMVLTWGEPTLEFRFSKYQRKYVLTIEIYIDDTTSTFPNPNSI